MSASPMPSRYFTSARMLLPCAETSSRSPRAIAGASVSCQNGRTRATVSFRHSVSGTCSAASARVARIAALAARIVGRERRRRHVVAAAPGEHLRVAELGRGLGLVEALQGAVVALVEAPVVAHRQPGAVHLVERVPERPDRALEHRASRRGRTRSRRPSAAARPARACSTPSGVRSTSVQPVKRFARFQVDSPWRSEDELVHGACADRDPARVRRCGAERRTGPNSIIRALPRSGLGLRRP